jgi:hypothetical protein
MESEIFPKLIMTNISLDETISAQTSSYDYDRPLMYNSVDGYPSITVTSFGYKGPQQNVMADRIHQLRQPYGLKHTVPSPTGRSINFKKCKCHLNTALLHGVDVSMEILN